MAAAWRAELATPNKYKRVFAKARGARRSKHLTVEIEREEGGPAIGFNLVLFVASCKRNRMKESDHDDQHAPLSYYGAWRIVWLVLLLIVFWLIVRSLEPVILLFALVFLLAMVLNPIVVSL